MTKSQEISHECHLSYPELATDSRLALSLLFSSLSVPSAGMAEVLHHIWVHRTLKKPLHTHYLIQYLEPSLEQVGPKNTET